MPDKQIAAENLTLASVALKSCDVVFFLFLGTALGAYRDKDFCPGDIDDIDLGVRIEDIAKVEDIKRAFAGMGFELEHEWERELSFVKRYEGWRSKIDIFFLGWNGPDRTWMFYSVPPQERMIDAKFFDTFDHVEFYGVNYAVPHPIEEYLQVNYGPNWRTPIPRDKWNWETDNKCKFIT